MQCPQPPILAFLLLVIEREGPYFFHQLECLSMHTVHSSPLWPPWVRMPYKAVNFQILWVSFQNPKIMCKIFSGFLIGRGFYLFGRSFFFPCTKTLFLSRVISPPFQYLLSIPFPFSPLKIFPLRPADSQIPSAYYCTTFTTVSVIF